MRRQGTVQIGGQCGRDIERVLRMGGRGTGRIA